MLSKWQRMWDTRHWLGQSQNHIWALLLRTALPTPSHAGPHGLNLSYLSTVHQSLPCSRLCHYTCAPDGVSTVPASLHKQLQPRSVEAANLTDLSQVTGQCPHFKESRNIYGTIGFRNRWKPSIHYRCVVTNYSQDLPSCVPFEEDIQSNAINFGIFKIWKALKEVIPFSEILLLYNETTSKIIPPSILRI